MAIKLAINGLGRIGGLILRVWIERLLLGKEVNVVAVVDLDNNAKNLAYRLKYDSTHGQLKAKIKTKKSSSDLEYDDILLIDGHEILCIAAPKDKKLEKLPWGKLGIDFVIDATGAFNTKEALSGHLQAGAKKVVLTVPPKSGEDIPLFVMGINPDDYDPEKDHIVSNASCTTNCLAPVAKVLNDRFKIKHGLMTTIHSYTNDQRILDMAHKDPRRSRAAALNMIPTSTGAAKAIGLVLPELKGKLDGLAIRVPTPNVSIVDLVVEVEIPTKKEVVNAAFKAAAENELMGILGFTEELLVSSDFNGCPLSSIVDAGLTYVINGTSIKVMSWYDNEWGYSNRVIELILHMIAKAQKLAV
ncbi:MAG: type I glyceraldehyde-3-phosphate dehydrogenase [Candidatus Parcubacteria bacterium]|nr:type I glyceraldehyde-3-phosphate dehydrogenase [Candidatus Parcubacteria bacterium]